MNASRDWATWRLFSAAVWLALVLVAIKAYYLGRPESSMLAYVTSLAAVSGFDVFFALASAAIAHAIVGVAGYQPLIARLVTAVFMAGAAVCCFYAVANIVIFGLFGSFLTYPLLAVIGDVRMVRSSVSAHLTFGVALMLAVSPLVYIAAVEVTTRAVRTGRSSRWLRQGIALAAAASWCVVGQQTFARDWTERQDRRVAGNPHWVLFSSWWRGLGDAPARLSEPYLLSDLAEFAPAVPRLRKESVVNRSSARARGGRPTASRRSPNVVLVVLESVAARWASLNGGPYTTTPRLAAEASRGVVFENFYAHVGRSSNSLAAMLMSVYPKIGFRDLTLEFPRLPGVSLADLFRERGYRTAFITPSDLSWAGWNTFLEGRGFASVTDYRALSCSAPLSSWGVEDRCSVDEMIEFIEESRDHPFFLMTWTQQTHHPYEPTPGVPLLDLLREPVRHNYDLGRYLNVLHETDRHIGRLFDALQRNGLDEDTVVAVTGDHGQAFGYPHDSYWQGRTVYEEDVHVPLMLRFPRNFRSPVRSAAIGGHIDLGPTLVDLLGMTPPAAWQGRSLFDSDRGPRAYFYVAEEQFKLGVREGRWKYIVDLREGVEELYDLQTDPMEQMNVAAKHFDLARRLRQRLAAWSEANRRQYERTLPPQT